MNIARLSLLAAGATMLLTAASSSASAAPTITEAFLANVRPNVAFLDQSSALALNVSKDANVRSYAQGEVTDATRLADALATSEQQTAFATSLESGAPTTGRSVAIDGPEGGLGQAANGRSPLGAADLAALAKLSGRKFLDAYWLKQVDALYQLRADYQDYAANGDDPALVAMSQRELKAVEHRLELLSKI